MAVVAINDWQVGDAPGLIVGGDFDRLVIGPDGALVRTGVAAGGLVSIRGNFAAARVEGLLEGNLGPAVSFSNITADAALPILSVGARGVLLGSAEGAVHIFNATAARIVNDGTIEGHPGSNGITAEAGLVQIVNRGAISGRDGIGLFAANARILNEGGSIHGSSSGIYGAGAGLLVENSGTVSGARVGIALDGANGRIANSGTILSLDDVSASGNATFAAVFLAGPGSVLTNSGTIRATGNNAVLIGPTDSGTVSNTGVVESRADMNALLGGGLADALTNAGVVLGAVRLGGGADLYDGRDGTVSGIVAGDAGADTLLGGAGAERLDGGAEADLIEGDGGEDSIAGGLGADTLDGGAGFDLLDYAASTQGVSIDLAFGDAAGGEAAGDEIAGFEAVRGSSRADTIAGDDAANWLAGGINNDILSGGGGNDTLLGEVGADTLTGGAGADLLIGSNLPDVFRYLAVSDSTPAAGGRDRIRDFRQADLDRIDLSAIDAATGQGGNQAFAFIGAAAFSGVQGQLRAVVSGAVTIVEADTDGNAVADLRIVLNGAITLGAADFVL